MGERRAESIIVNSLPLTKPSAATYPGIQYTT